LPFSSRCWAVLDFLLRNNQNNSNNNTNLLIKKKRENLSFKKKISWRCPPPAVFFFSAWTLDNKIIFLARHSTFIHECDVAQIQLGR
jgi:hypothetical protein